jgi:hypothetical protein
MLKTGADYVVSLRYLAGNMIDAQGLDGITEQLKDSKVLQALWLKRNPLGPQAIQSISTLITTIPTLITLDLDQTELEDKGVAKLFDSLVAYKGLISLETIYLNSNGIGLAACEAISRFLAKEDCALQNLYMSGNPIGDDGALYLAKGLETNNSLKRINFGSCGINSKGAIAIMRSLCRHPAVISINLAQAVFTADLKARHNYIDDSALPNAIELVETNHVLRVFTLGTCAFSPEAIGELQQVVSNSQLFFMLAKSCFARVNAHRFSSRKLASNVQSELGLEYQEFLRTGIRSYRSPPEVRLIDSVYRTRDMGQALRKQIVLKKLWDDDDETLRMVEEWTDEESEKDI